MDYKPRYSQPFTFAEAAALDVSIISEEIARLRNSLTHLQETQRILEEEIASQGADADSELTTAFQENKNVIGSQQERISMLQLALHKKGVIDEHYTASGLSSSPFPQSQSILSQEEDANTSEPNNTPDDDGIDL
ncbi:hypothetical protein AMATHDRAFT_1845 [Amanita thiersii Skay4041]|uniref:Uncharacterized protein n=1 Tax=Amanita thiersii Skay4041 TaxID=703135 RepID=A0A2A9NYA9_9AGAR|nr:hypothetical protein AMATHDRAFT_1845 [Amanita thiersii Skay4041]